MSTYKIEVNREYSCNETYSVKAKNKKEAEKMILDGKGERIISIPQYGSMLIEGIKKIPNN